MFSCEFNVLKCLVSQMLMITIRLSSFFFIFKSWLLLKISESEFWGQRSGYNKAETCWKLVGLFSEVKHRWFNPRTVNVMNVTDIGKYGNKSIHCMVQGEHGNTSSTHKLTSDLIALPWLLVVRGSTVARDFFLKQDILINWFLKHFGLNFENFWSPKILNSNTKSPRNSEFPENLKILRLHKTWVRIRQKNFHSFISIAVHSRVNWAWG